ncbi:MAG: tripartite tricarboxylate transporter substrate binding protein [Candidatus Protistobacter heckmanni]|nr:tripartite tricarboxylate transporter substrate binding protein [Candidatus Protistobacter heckmanni]
MKTLLSPLRSMCSPLRGFAAGAALLGACLALPVLLTAQEADAPFPSKLVTLVVPFPPGGPTDALARTLAAALKDTLQQTVVVENLPGAGGKIGAEYVARANPDGYTVLFGTSFPLAINANLFKKAGYDPLKDFDPVILIGHLPNILVINPGVPAKTMAELVQYARANPGKLSFASLCNGASSHLAGVLFGRSTNTQLVHVPYKGTGPALNDLLGGQVSMSFTDILTAMPHVKAGTLRALGVTTAVRSPATPQIPTLAEQGLKGFDVFVFFGVVVPKGTPVAAVKTLNNAFVHALSSPKVSEVLAKQGIVPAPSGTPDYLSRFMHQETAKWEDVVEASGAQLD